MTHAIGRRPLGGVSADEAIVQEGYGSADGFHVRSALPTCEPCLGRSADGFRREARHTIGAFIRVQDREVEREA